jgi:hypothetical protein
MISAAERNDQADSAGEASNPLNLPHSPPRRRQRVLVIALAAEAQRRRAFWHRGEAAIRDAGLVWRLTTTNGTGSSVRRRLWLACFRSRIISALPIAVRRRRQLADASDSRSRQASIVHRLDRRVEAAGMPHQR